jgi:hypothetical protein
MPTLTDHNVIVRVFDWIVARINRDNELASMSRADVQLLATDIGVSEADLRDMMPRIGDHSDLMNEMMLARGLDPEVVRLAFKGVMRDMEVTCARCRDSGTCRMELEAGTASTYYHDFCPNAGALDDLQKVLTS